VAVVLGLWWLLPLWACGGAGEHVRGVAARADGRLFSPTKLLLSGIIAGMFFSAVISVLMYLHPTA
jgi:ABC-type Fe3+-siderophore transport system permease subunit